MDDVKNKRLDGLREFKENLLVTLNNLRKESETDLLIDEIDIDGEAIRTPKIYGKWLGIHSEQSYTLKQINATQKKIYLERWKYYSGKATDKYYQEYGVFTDKVIKAEIDMYLAADEFIIAIAEVVELQSIIVNHAEKTIKEISQRGYHIKSVIEWRKFQAGS